MKKTIWTMMWVMGMMLFLVACGGEAEPAVNNPSASGVATAAPTDNQPAAEQPAAPAAEEENNTAASPSEPAAEVQPVSLDENGLVDPTLIVIKGSWTIDPETGFLHAYGSITNNSDHTITGMIDFMYYDDNGQALLASNFTNDSDEERTSSDDVVFSAPIAPGATGYYNRVRDLAKVDGQITKVESFLKYAIAETGFPTMDFANLKWEIVDEVLNITATLSNNGNSTCVYPSVAIAFLKGGEIIGVETGIFEPELNALEVGQTQEVTVNKYMLPAGFDEIQVVGDCASTSFTRE